MYDCSTCIKGEGMMQTDVFLNGSRADKKQIETALLAALKFDDRGLIAVATSDAKTGMPLMMAYMNAEAVAKTIATGEAHYYSRSRQSLWHKGATSGEVQIVKAFYVDCDQDGLWMQVEQKGGGCCHVGYTSCFYRKFDLSQSLDTEKEIALTMADISKK